MCPGGVTAGRTRSADRSPFRTAGAGASPRWDTNPASRTSLPRARPEQYILRVRRAADTRLDLVSSGAADHESVDHLAQQLASDGVRLVTEPDAL